MTPDFDSISQVEINRHIAEAKAMRAQEIAKLFKSVAQSVRTLFAKLVSPVATLATK